MAKRRFRKFNGEKNPHLPQSAMDFLNSADALRSGYACWTSAYYEGDNPETATNWIITMDDGGYYKVGAEYITWYKMDGKEEVVAKANWNTAALNRTLKALRNAEEAPFDPNYQT